MPFFVDRGTPMRILEEALALERKGCEVNIVTYHLGRNIGELDVILDVAAATGLDREEVRRMITEGACAAKRVQIAKEAEEKQIEMVPTFIINDRHRLVGVLSPGEFRDLFAKLSSE